MHWRQADMELSIFQETFIYFNYNLLPSADSFPVDG